MLARPEVKRIHELLKFGTYFEGLVGIKVKSLVENPQLLIIQSGRRKWSSIIHRCGKPSIVKSVDPIGDRVTINDMHVNILANNVATITEQYGLWSKSGIVVAI